MQLLLGFLLGVLASGIAALVYEYGMRPKLEILVDESLRAKGQKPGQSPHEFHHLKVRNIRSNYPLPGRRPAWSCKVTMEVFDLRGSRVISDTIVGRWIYQPEPLIPVLHEDQVANLLDVRLQMDVDKSGMRFKRGFLPFVYPFSSVHAILKEQ